MAVHRRHHFPAASRAPREVYTDETRDRIARQVTDIHAKWSAATPDVPAPLHDPRLPLAVIKNESDIGRLFRTKKSAYMGWFQLSARADKDVFGMPKVQQATADKMNLIGKTDPEAMKINGKDIKEWTPQLVAQNFARHPYLQTVGFLECAKYNNETYKLGLERFSTERAAALIYQAHVIPAVAKNTALDPDSKASLASINSSAKIRGMIRGNPTVFQGGVLNPLQTLDRWVGNFFKPMEKQFAGLIDGAQQTAENVSKGVKDFARHNAEAQSAALMPGAKRSIQTTQQASVNAPGTKVESTTFGSIAAFFGFGSKDEHPSAPVPTQTAERKLPAATSGAMATRPQHGTAHMASAPPPTPKKIAAYRRLDS